MTRPSTRIGKAKRPRQAKAKAKATLAVALCVGLGLATFGGCEKTLPATVTGTVTLDGQPLPERDTVVGNVMFYPSGGGAAAFGDVTSGGAYKVTTGSTSGLQPGEYVVTVTVSEMEPEPPGGYQNAPGQKRLTPARYNDRDRTPLRFEVSEGPNEIDLPLESDKR